MELTVIQGLLFEFWRKIGALQDSMFFLNSGKSLVTKQ